jgi:hypothetical protein
MDRRQHLNDIINNPWLSRVYNRLTPAEVLICNEFILANTNKGHAEFELGVNRIFIDKQKPKHWKEILEILSCVNSTLINKK